MAVQNASNNIAPKLYDSVMDVQPHIFKNFKKEPTMVNGKSHYTSLDGTWILAFKDCGIWAITNDTNDRYKQPE